MRLFLSFAVLLCLFTYRLQARTYDVGQQGCRGDNKTLNTQALQTLIDRVSAKGGGTLYFPTGTYLSGTLFLKSNITLDLSAGAVLAGVPDRKAYPQLGAARWQNPQTDGWT